MSNFQGQPPFGYLPVQVTGYPQMMPLNPQAAFVPNFQPTILVQVPVPVKPDNAPEATPPTPLHPVPEEVSQPPSQAAPLGGVVAPEAPRQRWKREDDK